MNMVIFHSTVKLKTGILTNMKLINPNYKLSSISGILIIALFCIFTFTALALFPSYYNPVNNWLSDLGNSHYNPLGSIFFNTGCILTGLLLFPFFAGLKSWYTSRKLQKNLLKIGQLAGFIASFALIMIGIFSEDYGFIHWQWSALFFITLLFVLIITNVSLKLNPLYKNWIFIYGIIAILIDLFFIMLYLFPNNISKPLFEWLSVFASLVWVGMLVYNMGDLSKMPIR